MIHYLTEKELNGNTLIICLSDNGWVQDTENANRYVEGSKRAPYDLGIRTPVILSWPDKIHPVKDTLTLVSSIDMLPTIEQLFNDLQSNKAMQGISLLDRFRLRERNMVMSEVFYHDIRNLNDPTEGLKYRVLIKGEWKLILPDQRNLPGEKVQLYQILEDPFEKNNLAEQQPELIEQLITVLDEWWDPYASD